MEHESVYAVTNPETGRSAYPATSPEGYPVTVAGAVQGCDCERCEDRRDLDMVTDDSQPTGDANYCLGTAVCPDCEGWVEIWTSERGDYTLQLNPRDSDGEEHSC
jgi:hypothetical protein